MAISEQVRARVRAQAPIAQKHVKLFNPRTQQWSQNFAWSVQDQINT
jgi:hypothetical protein